MRHHELRWILGALGLVQVACFVAPDTLGEPCLVDEDCFGGQVCVEQSCAAADSADASGDSTQTDATDSTGDEDTNADDTSQTTGDAEPQGALRFVHASPDLGPVDIYVAGDDTPLQTALNYGEASNWFERATGDLVLEVRPSASSPQSPPLLTGEDLTLADGERFTGIVAGSVAAAGSRDLRLLRIFEDWGSDRADRARVRLVHASPDAPDFTVEGLEGPSFGVQQYGASSADGIPLDVEGGTRLEFLDGEQLLTSFTAPPLSEGDQVLVVAAGFVDSLAREADGFGLLIVGESGLLGRVLQDPQVFTLHGARDAGNLENCTNGFEVAANFTYGEVQSAFLSPGDYDFEIHGYPSGCTGVALNPGGNASGMLDAGERYLLLLTGEQTPAPGEPSIQVATFQDRFPAEQSEGSAIRFVHGASAQQIYVGEVTDGEVKSEDVFTSPIAWRSESVEVPLPAASYLLGVADAVGKPSPPLTPLVTFDYAATAGARQWGIISGDPSPEEGDGIVQLMLIDTATPDWAVQLVDINP